MDKNEIMLLLSIEDRIIAEEIQGILDQSKIYTTLISDSPASSVLNAYTGFNPMERIDILINKIDFQQAIEILNTGPYSDLIK